MPRRLFVLFIISIIFSCSSTSQIPSKTAESQLIKVARAQYQTNYKILFNRSKTSALCISPLPAGQKIKNKQEQASSFFIFDLQKEKMLYSESLGRGMVKWLDDTRVEIRLIPGIIKGGENMNDKENIYIYDIVSAKKYKQPFFNNRD